MGGREGRRAGRLRLAIAAGAAGWVGLVVLLALLGASALLLAAAAALPLLAAGGLGGRTLWRRYQGARQCLEATRAELGSIRGALDATRTELGTLRRRLGEAERLATVGTMSAQIAHQLRNPLTSMGLYVQLLEDDLRGGERGNPEEAVELLELVLNEQRNLVEITDNYLQYARLPTLEPTQLDLNETVGELVRFLRHEVERKGIAVSTRFQAGLPPLEADRRLLRFALMNLLRNAVEAMGPGGRLRVHTAQQNGAVEVHVSDTGEGIEPSDMEHIFEPFYTTKEAGSGLGLSLSRQIAERHEGSLACESMVGVGSTFVMRLPVQRKPEANR